ncbi:hypothetical protein BH24ACI3_BH24ACI3_12430 [soil metagenome]
MKNKVKTISATEFKAKCLQILDELGADGIMVEKRGTPVARVTPVRTDDFEIIGCLEGEMEILGDIMATGIKWNAES